MNEQEKHKTLLIIDDDQLLSDAVTAQFSKDFIDVLAAFTLPGNKTGIV